MYLGGLFLIIVGCISLKTSVLKERQVITLNMSEEITKTDLNGINTVKIQTSDPSRYHYQGSSIDVIQAEGGSGSISYPVSPYIKTDKQGSTLVLKIDYESFLKENEKDGYDMMMQQAYILVEASGQLVHIENETLNTMKLEGLTADSLSLASQSKLEVNNCNINSAYLLGSYIDFVAVNTTIQNMHADLDGIKSWTFTNSTVQNQYLTGSHSQNRIPYPNQTGEIFWQPKTDNAELVLSVKQAANIKVIQR